MTDTQAPETVKLRSIDEVDTAIGDKLIKMLALAKRGSTEHETQAAMSKAVAFATKHAIDMTTVNEGSLGVVKPTKEAFMEEALRVGKGHRRPPANKYIVWILQAHFGVQVVYGTGARSAELSFIGRKSQVVFATFAYRFLHRQFTKIWLEYKRKNHAPMSARNSVFVGIYDGLDSKLSEAKTQAEKEAIAKRVEDLRAEAEASGDEINKGITVEKFADTYQLAVVTEKEELTKEVRDRHPVLKTVKSTLGNIEDYEGLRFGREKGKTINVNMPVEGGNKKEGRLS